MILFHSLLQAIKPYSRDVGNCNPCQEIKLKRVELYWLTVTLITRFRLWNYTNYPGTLGKAISNISLQKQRGGKGGRHQTLITFHTTSAHLSGIASAVIIISITITIIVVKSEHHDNGNSIRYYKILFHFIAMWNWATVNACKGKCFDVNIIHRSYKIPYLKLFLYWA